MFTRSEVKKFLIKYGKKWFFPDFANKLTWFVASTGGAIVIAPTALKEIIYNWLVDTVNLNAGEHFTMAELQASSADYWLGFGLIALALIYNIAHKYVVYLIEQNSSEDSEAINDVDRGLFRDFLRDLPSGRSSVHFLRTHDFYNSFNIISIDQIDNFTVIWDNVEKEFLDTELEGQKKRLYEKLNEFNSKLSFRAFPIMGGEIYTCIPDACRGAYDYPSQIKNNIDDLNELARECYRLHQEFIQFARQKLKC